MYHQVFKFTARSNTMGPGHKHTHKRTTNVQDGVHRQVEFEKTGNWLISDKIGVINQSSLLQQPGRDPDGDFHIFIFLRLYFLITANILKFRHNLPSLYITSAYARKRLLKGLSYWISLYAVFFLRRFLMDFVLISFSAI